MNPLRKERACKACNIFAPFASFHETEATTKPGTGPYTQHGTGSSSQAVHIIRVVQRDHALSLRCTRLKPAISSP